jgi:hypothetical protein
VVSLLSEQRRVFSGASPRAEPGPQLCSQGSPRQFTPETGRSPEFTECFPGDLGET